MRIDHDIPNVRNRIEAARKSPDYHCRMFVDIPIQVAERMCDDIARLTAENARMRSALNEIAAWSDGPEVRGHFDEPGSATIARRALADADTGEGRGEGWIACSERMPDEDGNHNSRRVLACVWYDENPQPQTWLCRTHRGQWWHDDGRGFLRSGLRVSHWRPLPAPPRADDEKEGA